MNSAFFVGSNIIMYAAGADHAYRSPCLDALDRISRERQQAVVSSEVHQEILHRYVSIGLPDKAREVSVKLETIIPATLPVTPADIRRVRQLAEHYPGLGA